VDLTCETVIRPSALTEPEFSTLHRPDNTRKNVGSPSDVAVDNLSGVMREVTAIVRKI
jgi:hypothetical protein